MKNSKLPLPVLIGVVLVLVPWIGVLWLEWKNAKQVPNLEIALTDQGPCLSIPGDCRWHKASDGESVNIYCHNGTVATWSKTQRPQAQGAILQKLAPWQIMLLKDEAMGDKGRADYLLLSTLSDRFEAYNVVVYYNSSNLKLLGSLVACQ